jgi:hypothetical protein
VLKHIVNGTCLESIGVPKPKDETHWEVVMASDEWWDSMELMDRARRFLRLVVILALPGWERLGPAGKNAVAGFRRRSLSGTSLANSSKVSHCSSTSIDQQQLQPQDACIAGYGTCD